MANLDQDAPRRNGNGHDHTMPPGNGWDYGPRPASARRIAQARRRRAKAIEQGRKLFSHRTLGDAARIEARLRQAHALYERYRAAGATILEIELLD